MAASHSRTVLSSLAVAKRQPSGLYVIPRIKAVCPLSTRRILLVFTSDSRTVESPLAITSVWPSGLKATAPTAPSCSLSSRTNSPLVVSHSSAFFLL